MNRTKVRRVIEVMHIYKNAGENEAVPGMPDNGPEHLLEALEEIASEKNIEAVKGALPAMVNPGLNDQLLKLLSLMQSVHVPKEVVYAYPVTMQKHFDYYCEDWVKAAPVIIGVAGRGIESDDFGCEWQRFTAPKELVEHLRKNNVPIKVCE